MPKSVRVTKVFSSEREIVVGVDGSEHSKRAVEWAIREAKLRGAVLRPVCVAPVGSDVDFDWSVDNSLAESQEIVDHEVEEAPALEPTVVVRGEVLVGPIAETLARASEVADLLVVGARGRGAFSEFLLGSVSRSCAHEARCPVVIVHELAQPAIGHSPSHIVVDVEKEKGCGADALDWATEEAALRSVRVETVFDCATSGDDDATVNALAQACKGADLLVIGDVNLDSKHHWLAGSFLRHCVQLAPCPVVVIARGPGVRPCPAAATEAAQGSLSDIAQHQK
jgi:nucleotide-binding universal stress UspA family protein